MLTVTALARKCGLSRATILYYEREGLLKPKARSENGYRWYGESELRRLASIVAYRSYGLPVSEIRELLDGQQDGDQASILKEHFHKLEAEVERLKEQQRAIVIMLKEPGLLDKNGMTKEQWVAIMRASGFDDDGMHEWHRKFEQMEPDAHQQFLESLGIPEQQIKRIRRF